MLENLAFGVKELLEGKARNENNWHTTNSRLDRLNNQLVVQDNKNK